MNEAYQKRLSLLHGFIQPVQKKQTSKIKKKTSVDCMKSEMLVGSMELPVVEDGGDFTIAGLVSMAKNEDIDIVKLLKTRMPVVEVAI